MKIRKVFLGLGLASLLVGTVNAQTSLPPKPPKGQLTQEWVEAYCNTKQTGVTMDMLDCGHARLELFDQQLNAAYKELMKVTPDKGALRKEQRQWIKDRDKYCKMRFGPANGSIAELQAVGCLSDFTQYRTTQLENMAEAIQFP